MDLIIGATGLLGGEICRLLTEYSKPVKGLIRPTSDLRKVELLKQSGVVVTTGDLKDPVSLEAACQGVTSVISTASSTLSRQEGDSIRTVDEAGQLQLIEAAKHAGVERFVFVSFRTRQAPLLQYPLKDAKIAVEEKLRESGITYTVLQASYFMEIWLSPATGFDYANGKARIYGSGQSPISWVSVGDVAKCATAAMDHPEAWNAILEIGGPEPLSPLEIVEIFEKTCGKEFLVEHVAEETLMEQKNAATDELQESFAGLMLQYAQGDAIEQNAALQLCSRRLISVEDYAKKVAHLP